MAPISGVGISVIETRRKMVWLDGAFCMVHYSTSDIKNELLQSTKVHQSQMSTYSGVIIVVLLLILIYFVLLSRQKLTIANASIKDAYQRLRETQENLVKQNDALKEQQDEIRALNNNLEAIVEERTLRLKDRNEQLKRYAFFNAHKMRSPITTILGLYNLLKFCQDEHEQVEVYMKIKESIEELERMSRMSQQMLAED